MIPRTRILLVYLFLLYAGTVLSQSQPTDNTLISVKDTVKLNEVEISIKKIIQTGDKASAYPTKNQKSHAHDVYGLLKNLMFPQLRIDPLEKTVTSFRGEVLLCINGRICSADEIQSLDPEDIARVDYYSKRNNPDHPDQTEVIDFITLQRTSGGALMFNATQHLNKDVGNYRLTNHNYVKKSEFSFGLIQDSKNYAGAYKNIEESFQFPTIQLVRWAQGQPALQQKTDRVGYATYSYNNDNKTKAYISIDYLHSTSEDQAKSEHTFNSDSLPPRSVNNVAQSMNKALSITSSVSQQLKNDQLLTLDISASTSNNAYSREYGERITGFDTQTLSSTADERFKRLNGQLSYNKTFNDTSTLQAFLSNNLSITTIGYRNDYTADECLKAGQSFGYVAYSKKWTKLYLYGKLGFTDTYFNQSDSISKTYYALLPTVSADYQINDHNSIEFSAYMYNNTPSLVWQSNVQQRIDFLQVNRGNPHVKQLNMLENYIAYHLTLPKVDVTAYVWDLYHPNNIYFDVFNEGSLFVHTYVTDGSFHVIMPAISSTIHLLDDRLTTKLTCYWTDYRLTGNRADELSLGGFNGQINYTQKDFMFSCEYNTPESTLMNSGRIIRSPALYEMNVGYTFEGANLSVGLRNPWSNGDVIYKQKTKQYSSKETRMLNKMGDHIVFAKLSYRFRYGKKHDFKEKEVTTSTSSGILKGEL